MCDTKVKMATMREEEDLELPPAKRQKLSLDKPGPSEYSNLSRKNPELDDEKASSNVDRNMDCEMEDKVDQQSDASTDSDSFGDLSDLIELDDQSSEASWLPDIPTGPLTWVQHHMSLGTDPRDVIRMCVGEDFEVPPEFDQLGLWKMVVSLVLESTVKRSKLTNINTLQDVVNLLHNCHNIIVLTGAGVSVSCGIPDFRSKNGIYSRLAKDFPNLPNPQAMFDIKFFKSDQRPFFKFAKEIYPGQFEPSPCHKFIKLLETRGKLLRNYTQNIDTLEKVAGVERAVECHGSFATATCMVCKFKVDKEVIRKDIFDQVIPQCPRCGPDVEGAVMKPDIVFFGESLPEEFHKQMSSDKDKCDLLIVIGSSLKVRPVSLIPSSLPDSVPQIIINRERLRNHFNFDVELMGNGDEIIGELCNRLGEGWESLAKPGAPAEEVGYDDLPPTTQDPSFQGEEAEQEGSEDVVEHSADSGMGDLETGTLASDNENVVCLGSNVSAKSNCGGGQSARTDRVLEGPRSPDSGADSNSVLDAHGPAAKHLCATASSEQHSSDTVFQSTSQGPSNCAEVREQGDCPKDDCWQGDSATTSCHTRKRFDSVEAPCVSGGQADGSAPHDEGSSAQASALQGRNCTCQESDKPSVCPHRVCSAEDEGDREGHCANVVSGDTEQHSPGRLGLLRMREERKRQNIASRCKENQIVFISPNRYIFPGAEVYSDDSDDSDSDDVSLDDSDSTDDDNRSTDGSDRVTSQDCASSPDRGSRDVDNTSNSLGPFSASDDGQEGISEGRVEVDTDSLCREEKGEAMTESLEEKQRSEQTEAFADESS